MSNHYKILITCLFYSQVLFSLPANSDSLTYNHNCRQLEQIVFEDTAYNQRISDFIALADTYSSVYPDVRIVCGSNLTDSQGDGAGRAYIPLSRILYLDYSLDALGLLLAHEIAHNSPNEDSFVRFYSCEYAADYYAIAIIQKKVWGKEAEIKNIKAIQDFLHLYSTSGWKDYEAFRKEIKQAKLSSENQCNFDPVNSNFLCITDKDSMTKSLALSEDCPIYKVGRQNQYHAPDTLRKQIMMNAHHLIPCPVGKSRNGNKHCNPKLVEHLIRRACKMNKDLGIKNENCP